MCSKDKPELEDVMTGAGVAVFGVAGPMDVVVGEDGFRGVLKGDLKGLESALKEEWEEGEEEEEMTGQEASLTEVGKAGRTVGEVVVEDQVKVAAEAQARVVVEAQAKVAAEDQAKVAEVNKGRKDKF